MKTSFGGLRPARLFALGSALWTCTVCVVANAQPTPAPPPPNVPPSGPPAPGPAPDRNAPPALTASPLLGDEAPPPPAPSTDETVPPPPPPPSYEEPAPPPPPDEPPPRRTAGPFARGSVRLSLLIGTGWTSLDEYLILGAGVGYYLVDGLELGLDYEAWLFGDPVLHRLSPGVRYVFHMVPVIKPYVGAFYRHTFVNDFNDFNYVGGRAGLFYAPERSGVYVGGGAVYEHLLNCKDRGFTDCDDVYPEIFIGISLGR